MDFTLMYSISMQINLNKVKVFCRTTFITYLMYYATGNPNPNPNP